MASPAAFSFEGCARWAGAEPQEWGRDQVQNGLFVGLDVHIEDGRQRLVRHGHLPERTIQTGIGSVEVRQAHVRDRGSDGEKIRFSPAILPFG